jgi:hypothetical protein
MSFRILSMLLLVLLCACASSRPSFPREEVPAAAEPLPPEIKPLTMEQEEQANAMGAI